jgi:DeoR/GlpR family transcriptional regulator of sugar metabolism
MARNPKLTESTYKAVKIMLNGGATIDEVVEYLKLSSSTVRRIRATQNYEEYAEERRAKAYMQSKAIAARKAEAAKKAEETKQEELKPAEAPAQVVEHRQSVTVIANHYMAEQLQKQTELLTLISNKLAFIIDQLT